MKNMPNVHPGEVLREEFLAPLSITSTRLAKEIGLRPAEVEKILDGVCALSADTAIRLSRYFRTTPKFWLNLQQLYDLEAAE